MSSFNRALTRGATLLALAVTLAAPVVDAAQPEVYLSTKRAESKLVEVAVPAFQFAGRDVENLGVLAARIVNFDLSFTGYFAPNENYGFMRQALRRDIETRKTNYDEWRTLASNFLAKGDIIRNAGDKLSVEVRVYDLQARKLFFAKRYRGSRSLFRQMIHQFSDDFLQRMTGDKGIARTKIAFVSRVSGRKELFIMDYDGSGPRPITADRSIVLFPHWNPVRKNLILFTTYRYRNPDLYAIDLKKKTRYPISRRIGLNATGEWSRDGSKVVFSLSRRGNSDIYVSDATGANVVKLTSTRSIETSPTWSPDGRFIAFTSDRSGSPQLYKMNADGSGKRRLTYKGSYNDGASWSPKSDTIAFTSLLGRKFDIALINVRDRVTTRLTQEMGSNESPSWSPDGRHIAFMTSRTGMKQVNIMNANGGNMRQVTFLTGGGYSPSWGPD